ncbi:organic cation transporter protein-like [Neocloeon triangulifer]|uniref:organic cation transporter protein-like n=1 Tax=Neocloeon triangulifer TaxID=2078957 RepID=UPI00286ECCB2|nr:organic cation transporter protein-like [Neocloeon triangulifer]
MVVTSKSEQLDSIFAELGDFGRYQVKQYAFLSLPVMFSAAFTISYVFTAGQVPHRCLVPECGDSLNADSSNFQPPWLREAVPFEVASNAPSACLAYNHLDNATDTCNFDKSATHECSEWIFKGPENTIQSEFNLACSNDMWRLAFVGTLNNIGRLVGLPLHGYVSDRYGRKAALIFTMLGSGIFGVLRSLSWNYESFLAFEFLEAAFSGGIYAIAFILGMELVGPSKRVLGGAVIVWAYALGQVLYALIAWALGDWRQILLASYSPALLFVFYIWLIPESVRWLMSHGKFRDARNVIKSAAATNRVRLSEPLLGDMEKWQDGSKETITGEEEQGDSLWSAMCQVFTSKVLVLRLANCYLCWVTNNLVYYGLSLNAVSLAGTENQYLNFILVSIVEAPSYIFAWQGMTRFGRRKTLCAALIISGISCFTSPFVPEESKWIRLPLYLTGKFAITAAFDTLYIFTAEIFPTKLRTSLLASCSMVGRLGAMLAPQTPLLAKISPYLPLEIFGASALISGMLALLFPETLGKSLPDSVDEAKNLKSEEAKVEKNSKRVVPKVILTTSDDDKM